jgi:integrase/recombinase XerD
MNIEQIDNKLVKNKKGSWYDEDIKYLKFDDIKKLLGIINNDFHYMIFRFLYETAARCGEALKIKIIDIDFKNKTVLIPTFKKRNKNISRVVALSPDLLNIIHLRIREKELIDTDYLFARKSSEKHITNQAIIKAMKKYIFMAFGTDDVFKNLAHPHTLRHSRSIQLLNSGVNIKHVQNLLGHSNRNNTDIYLRYSNQDFINSIEKSNKMFYIE